MPLPVDPSSLLDGETLSPAYAALAERFADEGVPLRAIARALKQSTDAVRLAVEEAVYKGKIVAVPRDDWPVGSPRDARSPSVARAYKVDDENLVFSCIRLFKVTRLQASLLAVLINRSEVSRDTLHQIIESRRPAGKEETNPKMVDVVICNLRKRLKPFSLSVKTLWACGYFIEPAQRREILEMVTNYANSPSQNAPTQATQNAGPGQTAGNISHTE